MARIYDDITQVIGRTPLVRLNRLAGKAIVLAKMESMNPCCSVKDRIALYMIEDAKRRGVLDKNTTIIEPTSGNTGIGLAFICAARGYKLILTMPESMSIERRKLLKMLGAQIVLTSSLGGMKGAVDAAQQLNRETSNSVLLQQFTNPSNPEAHRCTTAEEIWQDTDGKIDILVSAVGTGGTITGCGEVFKERNSKIQIVAVEPTDSPVLSGGKPGSHKIQGIGAGFVPAVLNRNIIDTIVTVTNDQAFNMARRLAAEEGILAGISAGAACHVACELAGLSDNQGKTIVFIMCDSGERYLSTELFQQ